METTAEAPFRQDEERDGRHHQFPEFREVIPQEASGARRGCPHLFVFLDEAVAAQKEEQRHTIMPEVRKKVEHHVRAPRFEIAHIFPNAVELEGIFVFHHRHGQPVAEIVERNEQDGKAFEKRGVAAREGHR